MNGELVVAGDGRDARFCNVQGYWKFGKHLWARGVIPSPATTLPPPV